MREDCRTLCLFPSRTCDDEPGLFPRSSKRPLCVSLSLSLCDEESQQKNRFTRTQTSSKKWGRGTRFLIDFFTPGDRFSRQKIDNEQEARGREKEYTRGRHKKHKLTSGRVPQQRVRKYNINNNSNTCIYNSNTSRLNSRALLKHHHHLASRLVSFFFGVEEEEEEEGAAVS